MANTDRLQTAIQGLEALVDQYPGADLGQYLGLLRQVQGISKTNPGEMITLLNRFMGNSKLYEEMPGMAGVRSLVGAELLWLQTVQQLNLYVATCKFADLQMFGLAVGAHEPYPQLLQDVVFLYRETDPIQFVVYQQEGQRAKGEFELRLAAYHAGSCREAGWRGFDTHNFLGFIWLWPDGSVLLAVAQVEEAALVFRPVTGNDGWYDTGDWQSDCKAVIPNQEFFKGHEWDQLYPTMVDEFVRDFGASWTDLVNPDLLRGINLGYNAALKDRPLA